MSSKIVSALLIFNLCLVPTLALATSELPELIKMSCDAGMIENNNHIQYLQEDWLATERRNSEEYQAQIQEIESKEGAFSYKLVPELIGFGISHQEQSNFSASAAAFERALHLIRVNEGLYSTRQLPLIDLVIESNTIIGNWEQVADAYDLMYWLYRRNFAENDPRQLQTLKRMRRWYMEAYNKEINRSLEDLFQNSERIYEQALKIMWLCTEGKEKQSYCFWHKACCDDSTQEGYCPVKEDS